MERGEAMFPVHKIASGAENFDCMQYRGTKQGIRERRSQVGKLSVEGKR